MSFRKPFTVYRLLPGSYVDGVFVNGAEVQETIMASIQPLRTEDLINLPQGRRASDIIKIYTSTLLTTAEDNGTNKQPDRILWQGDQYEISSTSTRQMGVIPHFRYWAIRVPIGQ